MAKRGKLLYRARKFYRELTEFWWDFMVFCYTTITEFLYKYTLPFTSRYLSRRPNPPNVKVKDIRAKRIRLNIESNLSSPFNVEEFEVEWRPAGDPDAPWQSVGRSDLQQRTVARLKPDSPHQFRVRAFNRLGASGWSEPVEASTKIDPVDGGGRGPDHAFTWAQTATDVSVMFKLPPGASKRELQLDLKPELLRVVHAGKVLLDGELYGLVRGWDNGSIWTLNKERDHVLLTVTLEKQVKSLAPKFDYWRAIVPGHPEIDTHQLVSENGGGIGGSGMGGMGGGGGGAHMINPGNMDPVQLQSMGLGQFAGGRPT